MFGSTPSFSTTPPHLTHPSLNFAYVLTQLLKSSKQFPLASSPAFIQILSLVFIFLTTSHRKPKSFFELKRLVVPLSLSRSLTHTVNPSLRSVVSSSVCSTSRVKIDTFIPNFKENATTHSCLFFTRACVLVLCCIMIKSRDQLITTDTT